MSLFNRQAFEPSCPSGGTFYACDLGTNFVGCCNVEPCSQGCGDGSLRPASFDIAYYAKFPDQQCPTGSRWYTCTGTTPPFMGCCKSNPCSQGCPPGDLTAGFLSSNPKIAAPFLASGSSSSQTTSSSSSTTKSTLTSPTSAVGQPSTSAYLSSFTSIASTSTENFAASATAAADTSTASTGHKTSSGAIAGGVVGGIAVLAFTIAALIVYRWKSKKASPEGGMGYPERTTGSYVQEKMESSGKSAADLQAAPTNAYDQHGNPKDIKDSAYHGLPYPSPTPAYSPGEPNSQNPPEYPIISELDTPRSERHNYHNSTDPPIELPSPRSPSTYRPYRRPEASPSGLGIDVSSPFYRFPANETFSTPRDVTSEASPNITHVPSPKPRGDYVGTDLSSELSAANSVRISK